MRHLLLALVAIAALTAADPFDAAAFESGWKTVGPAGFAAAGVASDGQRTAVAWGAAGYTVSHDAGLTWSAPLLPSSGPVGTPGSVPVAVASAIITAPPASGAYIRSVDGVVRGPDGAPRNPVWGVGAITALAAGGDGTVYVEGADGIVRAIAADHVAAKTPGRLIAVARSAALVVAGTGQSSALSASGGASVAPPFHASAPAAVTCFAAPALADFGMASDGTGLRLNGHQAAHLGTPGPGVLQVACWGGWAAKTGGIEFGGVGLLTDASGAALVGQDTAGHLRRILASGDLPAGLHGIAPVASADSTRYRLIGATDGGVVMYRSRL